MIVELKELDALGAGLASLVEEFLLHLSAGLEDLRHGIERSDTSLVASICHRLEGGSAVFGVARMADLFAELGAATGGPTKDSSAILRRLEAELALVGPALRDAFAIVEGSPRPS